MSNYEEKKAVEGGYPAGEKTKVIHATNMEYQDALNTMHQILETARDGNFMLEADGKSITLVPTANVQFEIRAKQGKGRQSILFELQWAYDAENTAAGFRDEQAEVEDETCACVADQIRINREAEEREYAETERRFQRELFGGCGCVEVPGPQ